MAFDCDLCAGAGILRDDTNIVRAGTLPQLLYKALGAGGIQPILPAVGAEVGLAEQAVGTGRKTPGQLPIRIVAQLPAFAEQLEIQAAPSDGKQQLCTSVQGGHGVVHGVKITGSIHG